MDSTGEQLHPNWRALATLHIPLKRFIREGTQQIQQGTHSGANEKYEIQGVDGSEIRNFYEELVTKEVSSSGEIKTKKQPRTPEAPSYKKEPFSVNKYHRYSMENNVEKLRQMTFEGHDINVCDTYGWTSLMIAACEGSLDAVIFLLQLGVDIGIKDKSGKTAKDLARKKGHFQIEKLLEKPIVEEPIEQHSSSEEELETTETFFCDTCKQSFSETSKRRHLTSTLHQFNVKDPPNCNKLQKFNIPQRNKGLQLMVKQGWDKESGLGPSQSGRLYPVKTVIRKQRTGLGIEQEPARVTHFQAFDKTAVQRINSYYYKKKQRNRNDIRREKIREWKRDKRLRNELN